MTNRQFQSGDALLLVDVQNDFCAGGSLAVPDGDAVVPVLNRWIELAQGADVPILASRDWHPVGHCSFSEQDGPWPEHCVQDTRGAEFHPELKLPEDAIRISKGTAFDHDAYSAFDGTDLAAFLRRRNITRLWIGGLAQDVCVLETVLGACKEGFDTHLIADGTRAVDPAASDKAEARMREAGAKLPA